MLGSVYQVGRSVGWNVSWVLFVLFVDCLYISFTSLFFWSVQVKHHKRLVYRTFSLIQSLSLFPETRRHDRDTKNVVNTFRFRIRYQIIHWFYCNSFDFKKKSCHLIPVISIFKFLTFVLHEGAFFQTMLTPSSPTRIYSSISTPSLYV